jgi:hypothetical protein
MLVRHPALWFHAPGHVSEFGPRLPTTHAVECITNPGLFIRNAGWFVCDYHQELSNPASQLSSI